MAARAGYAARGVVYLLVGGFAIDATLQGGRARDSEQALFSITQEPLGSLLLGAIALGLLGYTLWRFVQSALDVDDHGTGAKGLAVRGGLMASAFTHAALATYAAQLALDGHGSGSSSDTRDWVAQILRLPGGGWMVSAAGLFIAGAGVAQLVKGLRKGFSKWLAMDPATARWAEPVCQVGLVARGVVFVIVGGLVGAAAVWRDPERAGGSAAALRAIQDSSFGGPLFASIAVGLFAFGIYSILEAVYRRVGGDAGASLPTRPGGSASA